MKMLIDTHTHTIASGHAYSTLLENIRYAKEKGLTHLAMTDHAPDMKHTTNNTFFMNLGVIPKNIDGIEVLKGVELNILNIDGEVDLDSSILKKLDIAIASLHMPRLKGESKEVLTEACIKVMENSYVDIMGHLGDPRYPLDLEKIMAKSVETGTIIEINNTSLKSGGFREGSDVAMKEILRIAKRDGIPIVLSTDAHFATDIGDFTLAQNLLKEVDFPENLVLNTNPEKFISLLKHTKMSKNL